MVPQEGNSNTPCFLLPPFQGEIKPPAMRVVVDFPVLYEQSNFLQKPWVFFFTPRQANDLIKGRKIMTMPMYTCKTCGSMAPEPGHLCDPTQAGEMYTCADCGRQAPLKKHVCKPMVARFQYYCETCGRGAVAENKLCKPKPII
jgi:hypothetical protein